MDVGLIRGPADQTNSEWTDTGFGRCCTAKNGGFPLDSL